MRRFYCFIGLLTFSLMGCRTMRSSASAKTSIPAPGESRPIVLTVLLKVTGRADAEPQFALAKQIKAEGSLKSGATKPNDVAFVVYFMDDKGHQLDSAYINNPLQERIEYENEQSELSSTIYTKEEAYTDVRVNYTDQMKKMIIVNLANKQRQTLNLEK